MDILLQVYILDRLSQVYLMLDINQIGYIKRLNKMENKQMTKTYNNIQDVSTSNLYKMLSLKQFQDDDHQKMIKDEIKFRDIPITMDNLTNLFKAGIVKNCK